MLPQLLLIVTGIVLIIFGLQSFLTASRRQYANEMIKAAALMVMGLFIVYFSSTMSSGGYNTRGYGGY